MKNITQLNILIARSFSHFAKLIIFKTKKIYITQSVNRTNYCKDWLTVKKY